MTHQANKLKEEGNVAYRDKQYPRAINCYTRAIQLTPNDPNLYSNRALSYFNIGEYMNCITDCDKAIQLNPALLKAHKKKASALAHLLKFGEAVTAMTSRARGPARQSRTRAARLVWAGLGKTSKELGT